jgi:Tfp pilus assembly protein PilN
MHNVEFLPKWYPALQRRKFAVTVQAAASLAILLVMAAAVVGREWNIHRQLDVVARFDQQIHQSDQQLAHLDQVLQRQHEMLQQERVIGQLGLDVDTTRLVNALAVSMPPKMTLTGLSLETQEQTTASASQTAPAPPIDRWLIVRVQGVAPTDVEVAILLDKLSRLKFLDSVGMSYIRDRTEAGHAMRDFELRFRVNLNVPAEGGA